KPKVLLASVRDRELLPTVGMDFTGDPRSPIDLFATGERQETPTVDRIGHLSIGKLDQCGQTVDKADGRVALLSAPLWMEACGPSEYKRDACGRVVQSHFAEIAVVSQQLAMVGREDDES